MHVTYFMLTTVADSRNTIAVNNSTDIFKEFVHKKESVKANRYSKAAIFQECLSMTAYLKSVRYG